MSKSDWDFLDKSDNDELNYRLRYNGCTRTDANRKTLLKLLEGKINCYHKDANEAINNNLDKFQSQYLQVKIENLWYKIKVSTCKLVDSSWSEYIDIPNSLDDKLSAIKQRSIKNLVAQIKEST